MAEEKTANNGESATPNASQNNGAGANDQTKQGGETVPQFSVPKRNAEYWEAAQKRREAREARKQFFAKEDGDGEGGSDDTPLTKKEYERLRDEDRLQWQEEQDKRLMSQSDRVAIESFLAKPENERFKKYEKEGLAILTDQAYSHADIALVFRGLAYDDALVEGASRGAKATERAARNSTSGTERRPETETSGYTPDKHQEFKKKLRSGKASFSSES